MNESIKKLTKIIDELTTVFLKNKASKIDIKLKKNTSEYLLKFSVKGLDYQLFFLDDFVEELDKKREDNAEEYYWQLNGTNEDLGELHLIGMMIDDFQVKVEDDILILKIIRKFNWLYKSVFLYERSQNE